MRHSTLDDDASGGRISSRRASFTDAHTSPAASGEPGERNGAYGGGFRALTRDQRDQGAALRPTEVLARNDAFPGELCEIAARDDQAARLASWHKASKT